MTLPFIALFMILLFCSPRIYRWLIRYRWLQALHLKQRQTTFNSFYKNINGFALSRQARKTHNDMSLTYGEVDFISFIALLSQVRLSCDTVFCDLGSGVGKAVIACILVYDIKQAIGIECLKQVHDGAIQAHQNLKSYSVEKAKKVFFRHSNFLNNIPCDSTVIFINAAAYFGELWQQIVNLMENLPKLETVITTKRIKSQHFHLDKHTTVTMSWGLVNVWVYQVNIQHPAPLLQDPEEK